MPKGAPARAPFGIGWCGGSVVEPVQRPAVAAVLGLLVGLLVRPVVVAVLGAVRLLGAARLVRAGLVAVAAARAVAPAPVAGVGAALAAPVRRAAPAASAVDLRLLAVRLGLAAVRPTGRGGLLVAVAGDQRAGVHDGRGFGHRAAARRAGTHHRGPV